MRYPLNWPRCPVCKGFALDGHITCGRLECGEREQRRLRVLEYWQRQKQFKHDEKERNKRSRS